MSALGIVETFNVIEHIGFGLVTRSIDFARCPFGLERGEEALHRCIVPDIARPAHGTGDAIVVHEPSELVAGVLAALVGMVQQSVRFSSLYSIAFWRYDTSLQHQSVRSAPASMPFSQACQNKYEMPLTIYS
jgi:hypothetical protein